MDAVATGHRWSLRRRTRFNSGRNGTEQRHHYRMDGDKLSIETALAPSIIFPGKTLRVATVTT